MEERSKEKAWKAGDIVYGEGEMGLFYYILQSALGGCSGWASFVTRMWASFEF